MNCQEAQSFVSALHDGETVPKEAAEHIGGCAACKKRLQEYAQMGMELRLLASVESPESAATPPPLPPQGRRWARPLTGRVLVPRFALALGVVAIVGLSVGLGFVRAQSRGLWFQFDVSDPATQDKTGTLLQAGDFPNVLFLSGGPRLKICFQVKAADVQNDLVRLLVRARAFEPQPGSEEEKAANYQGAVLTPELIDRILANTPFRELPYVPGQTLEIPVEGAGKLLLTGRVYRLRPSFSAQWFTVTPKENAIQLTNPALVRDHEFLGRLEWAATIQATNSTVGIYVPEGGAFLFALKPFDGATRGVAEFGEAHFKMDGHDYILFSATPITGGQQPREIWVYRDANYSPSPPPKFPIPLGGGDISNMLDFLRK